MSTRHPHNRWLILALISLPVFIGALDLTIVSAVLPTVLLDLNIAVESNLDDAAWVVSGYLMAYAITMSFMGRVSDLIGRRWVYLLCLLIFIAGSWLVATCDRGLTDLLMDFAHRQGQRPDRGEIVLVALIIGRVVQAIGAGAMVPVTMALVGDLFPPGQRAKPLGIVATVDTAGWVLGHLYGGVMIKWFSDLREVGTLSTGFLDWQILFLLNVPISAVVLVLTWWVLRGVPETRARGRFDILGAVFITLAHLGVNLGLGANVEVSSGVSSFEDLSKPPPYAVPMLAGGVVFLALFIWWELRTRDPLHNLRLFARRLYASASITNLFVGFSLMISLVSVPLLVNVRQEDTSFIDQAAFEAGILLSFLTVPMALAALPGGWLTDRRGYRWPAVTGLAMAVLGFASMGLTWSGDTPYALMAAQLIVTGTGLGLTFSPVSAAAVNSAPKGERGSVSALVIIIRLVGMTISMSSLTTFALRRVSALMGDAGETFDLDAATLEVVDVTSQVIRELMLLGAVVCALALVAAWFMQARAPASAELPAAADSSAD